MLVKVFIDGSCFFGVVCFCVCVMSFEKLWVVGRVVFWVEVSFFVGFVNERCLSFRVRNGKILRVFVLVGVGFMDDVFDVVIVCYCIR